MLDRDAIDSALRLRRGHAAMPRALAELGKGGGRGPGAHVAVRLYRYQP